MNIDTFIDLETAKERFMSNETLYKRFLFEFPERDLYDQLKENMAQGDVKQSFETAHRMKGIIENLSLNLLGRKIHETVELLRNGEFPDETLAGELEDAYRESVQKILEIKEKNMTLF